MWHQIYSDMIIKQSCCTISERFKEDRVRNGIGLSRKGATAAEEPYKYSGCYICLSVPGLKKAKRHMASRYNHKQVAVISD